MIYVSKNLGSTFKTRKQNKSGHFTRMPQIVKADEIPDPVPVGLLGASTVTTGADDADGPAHAGGAYRSC